MQLQRLTRQVVAFWDDVDVARSRRRSRCRRCRSAGRSTRPDGDPHLAFARQSLFTPFTAVFNVTGQPAMSVPLHWSDDGLPIGVQFVGKPFAEATLFRLAAQLEQARPWIDRRPPVSYAVNDRLAELGGERARVLLVARDDEARVVARERADNPGMLDLVDSARDRGRRAELRVDHDDVLRDSRAAAELGEHRAERLRGSWRRRSGSAGSS